MDDQLVVFGVKPEAKYMIAGWRRQWSDGGEISSGLPRYLIDKLQAKKIGELGEQVSKLCFPFQVPGTHDAYRPRVVYQDGLPHRDMHRRNYFYDAGQGLIIFLGEEPWFRIDVYGKAFFQAVQELGVKTTVAVEGYNGAAPPELERNISCTYSQSRMKQELEGYGLRFSNYGSQGRNGPTIGMALISIAHSDYPDQDVFRLGALAPLYPFLSQKNDPIGISRDHRAFYDIMKRLRSMFNLDIDLAELMTLGESESEQLRETLERISANNPDAKRIIDRARADYEVTPFVESVELDPGLDQALQDILENVPEEPKET
jgi:predicted ATP-grasp superfamily ATP-dependent carboligase